MDGIMSLPLKDETIPEEPRISSTPTITPTPEYFAIVDLMLATARSQLFQLAFLMPGCMQPAFLAENGAANEAYLQASSRAGEVVNCRKQDGIK
ncbi:hypothetical protein TNCT_326031 [Trichonephila clavata]|uniref:Uncharacterized protein n=1 Tax=Trichonephila clavata TaxID=2740835 RepID=A0A8X6EY46_TRICU|nr:hypothetical protein TNCT_326031 [Trichonephila clavata]